MDGKWGRGAKARRRAEFLIAFVGISKACRREKFPSGLFGERLGVTYTVSRQFPLASHGAAGRDRTQLS